MGILLWFGLLFPVMYSSYLTAQSMLFLFTLNLAQSVSPPPSIVFRDFKDDTLKNYEIWDVTKDCSHNNTCVYFIFRSICPHDGL